MKEMQNETNQNKKPVIVTITKRDAIVFFFGILNLNILHFPILFFNGINNSTHARVVVPS